MIFLLKLLVAHFLGDFLLQPHSWVVDKERKKVNSSRLYFHVLVHGVLVLLVFWKLSYWPLALAVALLHGLIDLLKLYAQNNNEKPKWFLLDQALHLASLLTLWCLWEEPHIQISLLFQSQTFWLYLAALFLISFVSNIVIRVLMSNWTGSVREKSEASLSKAGKYIGILERLLVFVFIVTNHWGAIGFLLAAKSVFRFGDLMESKSRKLTEYVLIGTLLSFGIAIFVGLLVLELLTIA